MRFPVAAVAALAILFGASPARPERLVTQRPASADRTPRLIVLVAVDQMRGDYIERFQQQWTQGLRRLIAQGAWFRQANYPYASTVTCAGHSTIGTGTIPSVHGMILNSWWDRARRKAVNCVDDESEKIVSYGRPVPTVGESLATLRDRLPAVVNTPELRFPCAESRKFAVIDEVRERLRRARAEVSDIDGVRVRTADGWWLLRASNTQDVLVARAEAKDEAGLARLKALLGDELKQSGIAPPQF